MATNAGTIKLRASFMPIMMTRYASSFRKSEARLESRAYLVLGLIPLGSKRIDQSCLWAAPTGHQVIAGHGGIAAGLATGDVVEICAIAGRHILRVDCRVDEANVTAQLLIDQRNETGPH